VNKITYKPIGIIHSPFKEVAGMPIQPAGAKGVKGFVEIKPAYAGGLKDLTGFSHIILLYHFHLSKDHSLEVKPFLDDHTHGVFATRSPARPNPIGISVVRLLKIEGRKLRIQNVDVVDGTPLLDIKPYVPEFDAHKARRIGWLTGKAKHVSKARSDRRF